MGAQLAAALVGAWLMAAPALLGYGDPARRNDRVVGPIAASVGVVAASEVTRALRWAQLGPGGWLLLAPWVLGYDDPAAAANSLASGAALVALAAVRGRRTRRFGGGWAALRGRSRP